MRRTICSTFIFIDSGQKLKPESVAYWLDKVSANMQVINVWKPMNLCSRISLALATTACLAPLSTTSFAQDSFVRLAPAAVSFQTRSAVSVGGEAVDGAATSIRREYTGVIELGRTFGNWSVSVTGGLPVDARASGSGSIGAFGTLGEIRLLPAIVAGQYRVPLNMGGIRFTPYAGLGIAYVHVAESADHFVQALHVESKFAPVLQLGVDFPISPSLSVFVDAKEVFYRTTATGFVQLAPDFNAPVRAKFAVNITAVMVGLQYRF